VSAYPEIDPGTVIASENGIFGDLTLGS